MYGTIARVCPKPGQESAVAASLEEWDKTQRPIVKGALVGYLFKPDKSPDELVMVAIFADKESYDANAMDPAQDEWYRGFRQHLQADPVWEDGEILYGS
jgi:quinol monooxygenase YgiN